MADETLAHALHNLSRAQLEDVIEGARQLLGERGRLVDLLVLYAGMGAEARQAVLDHVTEVVGPVDGLDVWARAVEDWD